MSERASSSSGVLSRVSFVATGSSALPLRSKATFPLPVCWMRYDSMSMFC